MKKQIIQIGIAAAVLTVLSVTNLHAQCGGCIKSETKDCPATEKVSKTEPQSVCPVGGEKINREFYVDLEGKRIYACCAECLKTIEKNPGKYLAKIKDNGETPREAPVYLCGDCGEIKGEEWCCDKNAQRCSECGLIKNSPGCCKMPEAGKDAQLCPDCGEIKGTDECCKGTETRKYKG